MVQSSPSTKKQLLCHFVARFYPLIVPFLIYRFPPLRAINTIILCLRQAHIVTILLLQDEDRGKIFFFARLAQKGEILPKIEKFLQ